MTLAEALDTTRFYRVAGRTGARTALVTMRPCRAPHHTISAVGLIGGARCRRRARCRWRTMGCSFWMNGRRAAATSWRSCASPSRRVLRSYNLSGISDLTVLAAVAALVAPVQTTLASRKIPLRPLEGAQAEGQQPQCRA
jgi:Magnesium chelatase, subunit ChlI